ncbi:hypothetical protein CPA56_04380 [Bombella sp. TMW2.1889]|uniref:DUF6538 domain-containing protein n=2 Tax=Bombella mellum TaxID=2039288 RepID=A0ABR5ZSD2_9PROT|nr:hypothetical protein [Bombella mellum]
MPNFIIRCRNGYYFRARLPAAFTGHFGQEVVLSLQTTDYHQARNRMPHVLRAFRDYLDRGLLTDCKALLETFRKTVSKRSTPDNTYAAERGARLMFLYGQPEF